MRESLVTAAGSQGCVRKEPHHYRVPVAFLGDTVQLQRDNPAVVAAAAGLLARLCRQYPSLRATAAASAVATTSAAWAREVERTTGTGAEGGIRGRFGAVCSIYSHRSASSASLTRYVTRAAKAGVVSKVRDPSSSAPAGGAGDTAAAAKKGSQREYYALEPTTLRAMRAAVDDAIAALDGL